MRPVHFLLLLFFTVSAPLHAESAASLPPAHVVPAASDAVIACQTGDTIEVSGTFTMTRDFDACEFQADGVTLASRGPATGSDPYQFQWTASAAGEHLLQVVYTEQGAHKTIGRRLIVLVTNDAPVVFQSLPSKAGADIAVSVAGTHAFEAARVYFYLDETLVGTAGSAPFTATLPLAAKKAGSYPLHVVAYDVGGRAFYSRTALIEVPARIKISAPATFSLQKPEDRAALTADILPDLNVAKVAYFWAASGSDDWKPLAEVASAPYSYAFDLSSFADGDYQVKATLTTVSGETYQSEAAPLTFKNAAAAEKAAKEAQAKANAEARAQAEAAKKQADADALAADAARVVSEKQANLARFLPRPGYDEKVFRRQLAELALASTLFPASPIRKGAVGMAEGLAALSPKTSVAQKAGSAPALSPQVPQAVTVLAQPGSGQVTFLGAAAPASRQVAQQAADYCKGTALSGKWARSELDMTFQLSDAGSPNGAASLGLADAAAVMSAASSHAVDESVVMSGAVDSQGDVQPVGGAYNVASVFTGPKLHTLIVPAGAIPESVLFDLYVHSPALCFPRRVVMVHAVGDALNYALIGWPHGSYVQEEKLIQGGLRHFAAGEDKQALAAFSAARDLDPGNWTAGFWITMLNLVEQQSLHDKKPA